MCRLFETIRIEDGYSQHLQFHNLRMNRSVQTLLGSKDQFDLNEIIQIPVDLGKGIFKCRVTYSNAIEKVIFEKYQPRKVQSLKLIAADDCNYNFKFEDRSGIDDLLRKKGNCDDILIVKNGLITECSFANIAFLKDNIWFTPSNPLLPGTTRERLLQDKVLVPGDIRPVDLRRFEKARIFNAMLGFDAQNDIRISSIVAE